MKSEYCLTCNGKKMAIVDNLESARLHIGSHSVECVGGVWVQSKVVGSLVAYDIGGNRWSVCRVSRQVAGKVRKACEKRHVEAFNAFLASQV